MNIYNLGSLNVDYVYSVDHFVSAGETLSSAQMSVFPGGKGLNQSVALARAGAKVIHGAILGEGGDFLLETLTEAGAEIERIERCGGSCGHAIIQVDPSGQNCILLFPGSNHRVDRAYAERFLSDAQPGDILILQNEVSALDEIFDLARQKQLRIAFNPSPFREELKELPLSCVTWWFVNEIEGEALFGSSVPEEIAERFAARYPDSTLILTLGGDGSLLRRGAEQIRQPVCPTNVVDTTAAGDTFMGYFMACAAAGKDAAFALAAATKAAAVAVSREGASRSIPCAAEIF